MKRKMGIASAPTGPRNDDARPFWPGWVSVILLIILGVAVYANALGGTFVYDDARLVQMNVFIKQWSNIGRIMTEDIGAGSGSIYNHYNFYRPIQILTYLMDHTLWGMEPFGYHLTSALLHVAVALALFGFAGLLTRDGFAAFAAAALYAVHPVHVEAVAYIAGRADSLAALFMLIALIGYVRYLASGRIIDYAMCLVSFIAACMSKEYALITPAFIALYHYAFGKRWRWGAFAPLLAIVAVYAFLRATVFNFPVVGKPVHGIFLERVPGMFIAYFEYLRLLVLPFGLRMEYGSPLFSLLDLRAVAGAALLAASVVALVRVRRADPIIFFGIGWFLVGLVPVSNLFPINAFLAEHWLYVPIMGVALVAGYGLSALSRRGRLRFAAAACLVFAVAYFSVLTVRQNGYWKDPVTFYERTLRYSPDNGRIYANLATEYMRQQQYEKAIEVYKTAIANMQDTAGAYNNLGITYSNLGRHAEAVEAYRQAIEKNPVFAEAYNNLGVSYADMGRKADAVAAFRRAIEINPGYPDAYANLGTELTDPAEKTAAYERALAINPYHANTCYNLSRVYRAAGRTAEADELYRRAKAIDPRLP